MWLSVRASGPQGLVRPPASRTSPSPDQRRQLRQSFVDAYQASSSTLYLNILLSCALRGSPSKMAIQELFRELDALELHHMSILFYAAVERHANFPRSCKRLRILDG